MIMNKASERRIALVDAVLTKHHRAASNKPDSWSLNAADALITADGGWPNRKPDEAK
jgi:hypothetical protein